MIKFFFIIPICGLFLSCLATKKTSEENAQLRPQPPALKIYRKLVMSKIEQKQGVKKDLEEYVNEQIGDGSKTVR